MKTIYKLLLIGILFWQMPGYGQLRPDALTSVLAQKTTYDEISSTYNAYFDTAAQTEANFKLAKHYSRWAYYQSMHLGPNKEFVNVARKNLEAIGSLTQNDAPQTSANGLWTFVGPSSTTYGNTWAKYQGLGRGDRIAFHPSNSSIIYVGTPSGGLWKTTDGGSTWTPLSNFIPSLGVSGIVISHANANTIYVLTGDGDSRIAGGLVNSAGYVQLSAGVLVSYDAGITWEQTGQLAAVDYVGFRLVQHPTNANILIAATSDGIYRTTDGGDTWVREETGKFYDVEFKPGTPTTVYASGVGIFRYSTDTGDTWNSGATFDHGLCGGRVEIAVTPDAVNKVYLFAAPKMVGNTFCGFYVSTNSGTSFTRLSTSPNILGTETGANDQSEYDMGLTVKPTDDQVVIAAGLIIYKSTNGGTNFANATFYNESGAPYIHPDIHYVAYNPLNNYLYAAGDGGFHRSTDDGATWIDLYNGLNVSQFYHMDDYDAGPNTIAAGSQDNGMKYRTTNTGSFYHCACCDAAEQAINYVDNTKGYVSMNDNVFYFSNYLSNSVSTVRNVAYSFFPQIELNSSDPTILYYSFNPVYKYDLDLNTHTQLGDNSIRGAWIIRTCPSNSNRIYAGGGTSYSAAAGSLYTSANSGTDWTTISGNAGFPAAGFPRISDVEVCPLNSSYVWAAFSGYTAGTKVVVSSNSGTSWTNISFDLPNVPVWSLATDNNFNVYAGTEIGVFFWAWGATHWEPFTNQMPNVPVSDLAINVGSDQLLAATFGRGIWKSQLRATCPVSITVASNASGPYFISASTSIAMSGQVVGGEGTDVALRAGNFVDLLPGFRANADPGNKFLGYLGPCDSGMPPDNAVQDSKFPVFPAELRAYEMKMTRNEGTLEVIEGNLSNEKAIKLRLFTDGQARIMLSESGGKYLSDIANYNGAKGEHTYNLNTLNLNKGLYYLYLIVNDKVMHIQELTIQ